MMKATDILFNIFRRSRILPQKMKSFFKKSFNFSKKLFIFFSPVKANVYSAFTTILPAFNPLPVAVKVISPSLPLV